MSLGERLLRTVGPLHVLTSRDGESLLLEIDEDYDEAVVHFHEAAEVEALALELLAWAAKKRCATGTCGVPTGATLLQWMNDDQQRAAAATLLGGGAPVIGRSPKVIKSEKAKRDWQQRWPGDAPE